MTLKLLRLITIIFVLMVHAITGYKAFSEEFIIPIIPVKYYGGKLSYNATHDVTHYIHSFSVGDTVFTRLEAKIYQKHWAYEYLISQGYKPYRDGTNLIINVSIGIDLSNIFDMYYPIHYNLYSYSSSLFFNYSFRENYINIPAFRTEIKRLADFLDGSGVVYSVYDLSKTFNSVLSYNIEAINYLQKFRKYYEESAFIQKIKNFEYYNERFDKWKFKVGKKKFKYYIRRGDVKTGEIYLSESGLNHFQEFLDKKKINLKLSEYIKHETTDMEAALIYCGYSWNDLKSYQTLTNYFESGEKVKYYILDLKDFVIGKVETPYWLY